MTNPEFLIRQTTLDLELTELKDVRKILQDSANTMKSLGQTQWELGQFELKTLEALARAGELFTVLIQGKVSATFMLQNEDPLFWPEMKPQTAFYLHKIAVAEDKRGQGLTGEIIRWAKSHTARHGFNYLRLDTDSMRPKLCALYESLGFSFHSLRDLDWIKAARYQMKVGVPDHTAVRTALWRALHLEVDARPHVFDDPLGLQLVAPDEHWRQRPDMHPAGTRGYRAGIVGRARLIEDHVQEQLHRGVNQYVIVGAGLDTFAQRRKDLKSRLRVFEIDRPETQDWKKHRLDELGWGTPDHLQWVPVDFEAGDLWWEKLASKGFDKSSPAVVASTGVSMYLTPEANRATLAQIANLAPGSTFAMSFLLPLDLVDPVERPLHERVYERAREAGTPFVSFFRPSDILELAKQVGFKHVQHISRSDLIQRYFAGRSDGLEPASGEEFLIAAT